MEVVDHNLLAVIFLREETSIFSIVHCNIQHFMLQERARKQNSVLKLKEDITNNEACNVLVHNVCTKVRP